MIKKCYSAYGECDNLIVSSFMKEIAATTVSGEFTRRLLSHKSAMMTAKYRDNRGSEWVKVL
ncbi:hypothetical protein CKG00_02495 [Morganella morganii]|uniref:Integrase n=1 Tax=Morganella morganii TaxID=582 RepID=A0A433ZTE0_MORMO|nr:hypothetical protein [Morganella morganii]RUT65393.1 hypothetical protein CKG00_02495 [Morganella morganii]